MASEESGTEDKYAKRIRILESKLTKAGAKATEKESCWPMHGILAGITPFLIGIILWFVKPGFVTKPDGNEVAMDYSKLLLWDLVFSAVLWAILYGHYYYFGSSGKVCSK